MGPGTVAAVAYVGWVVVARAGEELVREPAVLAFAGAVEYERVLGGWRELRITDTGEGDADIRAVVAATGGPVLAFYVVDDNCAIGEAAAPGADTFDVVLEPTHRIRILDDDVME